VTVDSRASVKTFARYDALVSYGIWSRIHHDDEFVEKINQTESVIKHSAFFQKPTKKIAKYFFHVTKDTISVTHHTSGAPLC